MGESGGLQSMGSHRVRHDWSNLAAAAAACQYLKTRTRRTSFPFGIVTDSQVHFKGDLSHRVFTGRIIGLGWCLSSELGTGQFSSVHSLSHVWLFGTLWSGARQTSLSITNSQGLLKLTSTESVMPPNNLILWCPFLPPSVFPSIRVFSHESALHIRWPKYWSFSISLSNEYSGLISFRMNLLGLLAIQGTLKSLIQHRSSKASIFNHSAFFIVQLSHPYMMTIKTIALTEWTFVGKVVSAF